MAKAFGMAETMQRNETSAVIKTLLTTMPPNQLNKALIEGIGMCRTGIATDPGCDYSGNPAVMKLFSLLDR